MIQYVPYEEALELNQLGFDEYCMDATYHEFARKEGPVMLLNTPDSQYYYSGVHAPIFQQAFRWFRNNHKLNGYCFQPNETGYWAHSLENKAKYDTYEEAELACLRELIEIVKQKND